MPRDNLTPMPPELTESTGLRVGDVIGPLELTDIAHGGYCVGRWQGQVIFTGHTLPGELVMARITEVGRRFAWATPVQISSASTNRIEPDCPLVGRCGGCDFAHATPSYQRELKRQVLAAQCRHLAGFTWSGIVEEVQPLTRWRSRMRYHCDHEGLPGLRQQRSHRICVLPREGCLAAVESISTPPAASPGVDILGVASSDGSWYLPGDAPMPVVREIVHTRVYRVAADGFWQVHVRAAEILVDAVLAGLAPRPGERAFDLYCGVGLFAGALVDAGCQVWGIEGSAEAIRLARGNVKQARFVCGSVAQQLSRLPRTTDLVVLDPPRAGARHAVVQEVVARSPRAIAYVACDPAGLARDLGMFLATGYRIMSLRAFDLFPGTHHVECVAILTHDEGDVGV